MLSQVGGCPPRATLVLQALVAGKGEEEAAVWPSRLQNLHRPDSFGHQPYDMTLERAPPAGLPQRGGREGRANCEGSTRVDLLRYVIDTVVPFIA